MDAGPPGAGIGAQASDGSEARPATASIMGCNPKTNRALFHETLSRGLYADIRVDKLPKVILRTAGDLVLFTAPPTPGQHTHMALAFQSNDESRPLFLTLRPLGASLGAK